MAVVEEKEGTLQNRPRQILRRFAPDPTFRPRSGVRMAAGLSRALPGGRQWPDSLEVFGALHLSGGHQQQSHLESG